MENLESETWYLKERGVYIGEWDVAHRAGRVTQMGRS